MWARLRQYAPLAALGEALSLAVSLAAWRLAGSLPLGVLSAAAMTATVAACWLLAAAD